MISIRRIFVCVATLPVSQGGSGRLAEAAIRCGHGQKHPFRKPVFRWTNCDIYSKMEKIHWERKDGHLHHDIILSEYQQSIY